MSEEQTIVLSVSNDFKIQCEKELMKNSMVLNLLKERDTLRQDNARLRALTERLSQPLDMDKVNVELLEFYEANEKYEWQTKDTAPRDGTEFLAYMEGFYYLVDFRNGNFLDEYDDIFNDFTHWLPLPSAPQIDGE